MDKASAARARVRASAQTQIAANPGGLAAAAIHAGQALLGREIQSAPLPVDQASGILRANAPLAQQTLPASLPVRATNTLLALERRNADRMRLAQSAGTDLQGQMTPAGFQPGLVEQHRQAQANLARLSVPAAVHRAGGGFTLGPEDSRVIAANADVARLADLIADANDRIARSKSTEAVLPEQIRTWLAGKTSFVEAPPVEVSRTDTIDSLRAEQQRLLDELDVVESAPQHSNVVKSALTQEIKAIARAGTPTVVNGQVQWARKNENLHQTIIGLGPDGGQVRGEGIGIDRSIDAFGLLVAMFSDEIESLLHRQVSTAADSKALTGDERKKRSSALEASLLDLERKETHLIEAGGNAVAYRASTDVRAILSLA